MIIRLLLTLAVISTFTALPQEKVTLSRIRSAYESFEYREVIDLSASFLAAADSSQKPVVNEVLLMKAVSHYALAEEPLTRKCFIDMLKNDRDIKLDSAVVSPKILDIFNRVRNDFLEMNQVNNLGEPGRSDEATVTRPSLPTDYSRELIETREKYNLFRSSLTRSLILPGLGHLYIGESLTGYLLTSASILTAAASVYYIFDTRNKEKLYLGKTDQPEIVSAYSDYNSSYKLRNGFLTAFAFLWVYAQGDILFFNNSLYFSPALQPISGTALNYSITFLVEL